MSSKWALSLEQNRDAEVTNGRIAGTAEAVRRGPDLRLFLIARGYEETLYFQQTNCDFILAGAPEWPFTWKDGIALGMVWPWASGAMISHLAESGHLPFRRTTVCRAMQWLVADDA